MGVGELEPAAVGVGELEPAAVGVGELEPAAVGVGELEPVHAHNTGCYETCSCYNYSSAPE